MLEQGLARSAARQAALPPGYHAHLGLLYLNTGRSNEVLLVDLRTGKLLWSVQASAWSQENSASGSSGLAGILISALVNQIVNTAMDTSHSVAGIATQRLLSAGGANGLLYGPRSPMRGRN